ncbi:hypothetical protein FRB99_000152 [Tulasnella sp. 403]|nr:hypothetical protein FRB99_000152 [Tulasnella sp. 403]
MVSVLNLLSSVAIVARVALAQTGQPYWPGTGSGTFQIVGESGASAQQLFLGTSDRVYIIDKTENNPLQVNGHPAWATEYNLRDNSVRPMDVTTNTFCAGGNVLGDGTWMNIGGNGPISWGGVNTNATTGDPYKDKDGRFAVRETLEDGSMIIIGGNLNGGFVSAQDNNNPTYEFWPRRGDGAAIALNFLLVTLPANLYPLVWLLPSGNLFMTTNWKTEIFDYKNNVEHPGPDMPYAIRTYPGSSATTMLPLTPANNWTATMVFCGGTNLQPNQWNTVVLKVPADATCVRISPDISDQFEDDDTLPDGRVMGNFILMPNGLIFLVNGVNQGTAGYGNDTWAEGHSYGTSPLLEPLIYNPDAPKGSRFSSAGLSASTVPRLYHSVATMLPDGSILVSGSNPNPDYTITEKWSTEYRVERFYPSYYSQHRPEPVGLPTSIGYGGAYFNVTLSATDLGSDAKTALQNTRVVIMRFGFSTHAITTLTEDLLQNFGQRYLQLNSTYSLDLSGSATLHVSQMPPNPSIFAPGPAWVFVVVNGVPSMGQAIMVGSGKIETQNATTPVELPGVFVAQPPSTTSDTGGGTTANNHTSGACRRTFDLVISTLAAVLVGIVIAL